MFYLHLRLWLLFGLMFSILYAAMVVVGSAMGVTSFNVYLGLSFALIAIQYLLGPKLVELSMHVRYIKRQDDQELYAMVEELAKRAGIPMPRVGLAHIPIPNAFAFGRSLRDGRVCVSQGIMRLLSKEELRAVLGHEISHLKNRDMLTITILSVVPILMYRIAWHMLFFGRRRNSQSGGANTALIGLAAFLFYFITNLLVLYGSRIREYFADEGSVRLGNHPSTLASSLYKLVYGSARAERGASREVEGLKAFFLNDPSRALSEVRELSQLDLDKSGTIDPYELQALRRKSLRLGFSDRMLELLSTHPNMLKRIKRLSEYKP